MHSKKIVENYPSLKILSKPKRIVSFITMPHWFDSTLTFDSSLINENGKIKADFKHSVVATSAACAINKGSPNIETGANLSCVPINKDWFGKSIKPGILCD